MRTVVIAEKEYLDGLDNYAIFLGPLLNSEHVVFCRWHPEAEDVLAAVENLQEAAKDAEGWRAIILLGNSAIRRKNPFDVIQYHERVTHAAELAGDEANDLGAERMNKRFAAYEQAACRPLTRLLMHLSEAPIALPSRKIAEAFDPKYAEYVANWEKKEAMRAAVVGNTSLGVALPQSILCLTMRNYTVDQSDVESAWMPHLELDYSRFYE